MDLKRKTMFGAVAAREKALRQAAIHEAGELFQSYGPRAIEILTDRIHAPELDPDERRRYRLARVEAERLGRERRDAASPRALVIWKPPLLSRAGLARLFGFGRGRRR